MDLKGRLKSFIKHLNIETKAFEAKCELSNGFVNNIGHSIREKSLNQILNAFPALNKNWLITGEGEMLLADQVSGRKMIQQPTEGYIPVYDISFSLGFTPTFINSQTPEILGYVNFPELRGSTYIVQAKGNSMAPLINDRDFVGIRPVKNKKNIDFGNPYGIITEDLAVFKKIKKFKEDDNLIMLTSENPEHDSYTIEKSEIIHLFSVIGILSVKSITY